MEDRRQGHPVERAEGLSAGIRQDEAIDAQDVAGTEQGQVDDPTTSDNGKDLVGSGVRGVESTDDGITLAPGGPTDEPFADVVGDRSIDDAVLEERDRLRRIYARQKKNNINTKDIYPLVSVLMSTYPTPENNRINTIEAAFQSLLNQTFRDFEVFVVDDGSPLQHEVLEKVKVWGAKFADAGINLNFKPLPYNTGSQSTPFNTAIQMCAGDLIAYLDDDCEWTPDHLEILVDAMQQPGIDLVYGYPKVVEGEPYPEGYNHSGLRAPFVPYDQERLQKGPHLNYIDGNCILHSKGSVVVQCLYPTGVMWRDGLMKYNDWEFLSRWSRYGMRAMTVDAVITTLHFHEDNSIGKSTDKTERVSFRPVKGAEAWQAVRSSCSRHIARVAI